MCPPFSLLQMKFGGGQDDDEEFRSDRRKPGVEMGEWQGDAGLVCHRCLQETAVSSVCDCRLGCVVAGTDGSI